MCTDPTRFTPYTIRHNFTPGWQQQATKKKPGQNKILTLGRKQAPTSFEVGGEDLDDDDDVEPENSKESNTSSQPQAGGKKKKGKNKKNTKADERALDAAAQQAKAEREKAVKEKATWVKEVSNSFQSGVLATYNKAAFSGCKKPQTVLNELKEKLAPRSALGLDLFAPWDEFLAGFGENTRKMELRASENLHRYWPQYLLILFASMCIDAAVGFSMLLWAVLLQMGYVFLLQNF